MKFEQLFFFTINFFSWRIYFFFLFIKKLFSFLSLNYLFSWKISAYGDSYWFIYSNKKSIHELRYLKNL